MHDTDELDNFLTDKGTVYDQEYPYYFNTKIDKKRKAFIKAKLKVMRDIRKKERLEKPLKREECEKFPDLFEKDC